MENNFERGFEKTAGLGKFLSKVKKEGKEIFEIFKHYAKKENNPFMGKSPFSKVQKEYKDLKAIRKHFKNK